MDDSSSSDGFPRPALPAKGQASDDRPRNLLLVSTGSLMVLGAMLWLVFQPVFTRFGPLRTTVCLGLVLIAALNAFLSTAVTTTSASGRRQALSQALVQISYALAWVTAAGLVLLPGETLFGRPEGLLAAGTVLALATLTVYARSHRPRH